MLAKIKLAVPQRNAHTLAFQEYNEALPKEETDKWTQLVTAWEEDPSKPNPFMITRPCKFLRSLHSACTDYLQLSRSPLFASSSSRRMPKRFDWAATSSSMKSFRRAPCSQRGSTWRNNSEYMPSSHVLLAPAILMCLFRRKHAADIAGLHQHATDNARAKVLEKQNTLHRKLFAWFKVQQLFIPGVPARRAQLMMNPALQVPHKMPLLLPSHAMQFVQVDLKLLEQEWALRQAQAHDTLADIRGFLELRCHLYQVKDRWVRGQGANTRAMSSIAGVQYKIDMAAQRYRAAHGVLTSLSPRLRKDGEDWRRTLRELHNADLRHVSEEDDTTESTRTMSWIWKQAPSPEDVNAIGWERAQGHLQECKSVGSSAMISTNCCTCSSAS